MKTLVAIPNSQPFIPTDFFRSFIEMELPDCEIKVFGSFPPTRNRNDAVKYFLAGDYEQLLWIDSDMKHAKDLLTRLEAHDKDIVSALYFQRNYPFYPIMFMENETDKGTTYQMIYNWSRGLMEVDSIGTGCVLIKRKVLEALDFPYCEYTRSPLKEDAYIGEDTYLFKKCKAKGFKMYVDTTIECRHLVNNSIGEQEARYALGEHYKTMSRLKETGCLDET